jgi:hypothetical protein
MKVPVPYYSQFVDVQDSFWMLRACGATSLKMVVESHLSVDSMSIEDGKKVPDIVTLCNEAKERGGYDMSNGWLHDYLVMKAKELGLQAYRKEGLTDLVDIIASLDAGNPVIVSVEKRVLEQTRFHMLVLVGYDLSQTTQMEKHGFEHVRNQQMEDLSADQTPESVSEFSATSYKLQANSYLYYHEPESTDKEKGQYRTCSFETFMEYWRGKAIFITK